MQGDTWLQQSSPTATHGSDLELLTKSAAGDTMRAVLISNLNVPGPNTVTRAMLFVHITDPDPVGDVLIYRATDFRPEGSSNWSEMGAAYDDSIIYGRLRPTATGPDSADVTALVQAWARGDFFNQGLMLISESSGETLGIASREAVNPLEHPYFRIDHENLGAGTADLSVVKAVDDPIPSELDYVTFTVTVSNAGPDSATCVRIQDLLPAGLTYESHELNQGSYTPSSGLWLTGTVGPLAPATLDVTARADAEGAGHRLVGTASVISVDQTDPDPTNDQDAALITVQGGVFRLLTGTYVGTGVQGAAVSSLPFRPDYVLVKSEGLHSAVARTASMPGDAAKTLATASPIVSGFITSLDAAGFSVGTSPDVNAAGVTYHWTAMQSASNEFISGSYQGDGADDRSVGGVGFSPAYALVMGSGGTEAAHRFATEVGDLSMTLGSTATEQPNRVQAFEADGFQVGSDVTVNGAGDTYHFLAWNSKAGQAAQITYSGDGLDDRPIGSTGFRPDFAVNQGVNKWPVFRSASLGVDQSFRFFATTPDGNMIQQFLPDGFEVGSEVHVNQLGKVFHGFALTDNTAPTADLALSQSVSDPTPNEGGTVTYIVTVTNNGPEDATGVILGDLLPAGVTYQIDEVTNGDYDDALGLWSIGPINNGVSDTLAIVARVESGTAGTSPRNTVTISALDQLDPVGGNDSAFADIDVQAATFRAAVGLYNGDGSAAHAISGLGFRPDVVLIKGGGGEVPVLKTVSMLGGVSKKVGTFAVVFTDGIVSLDADGFTVGGSDVVNRSGAPKYQWVAMRAASNVMALGAYVGDGLDDRSIPAGFEPDYAVLVSEIGEQATQRFRDEPFNECFEFRAGGVKINRIKDFIPSGLQIGTHPSANQLNQVHHWIALKNAPGVVDIGSYTGTGVDDTQQAGPGFQPLYVTVRQDGLEPSVQRADSMAAGYSQPMEAGSRFTNRIQSMLSGGFEVGDAAEVNTSGETYYYTALRSGRSADLRVTKTVDAPNPSEGDPVRFTLVLNNLGPDDATGVDLTDLLPAGLTYSADTPSQGSYVSGTGLWTVGTIAAADSAVILLDTIVDAGTAGTQIVNVGTVTAVNEGDASPGDESDFAAVDVSGAVVTVTGTQPTTTAAPGQANQALLMLGLANSTAGAYTLQSLTLSNATTGPGSQAQLDAELGQLTLFLDDGDLVFEPGQDAPLTSVAAAAGSVVFPGLSVSVTPGGTTSFHVASDLPAAIARDGDTLDLTIAGSSDVVFDQPVAFLNAWPLAPPGNVTIDGMVVAQISVRTLPSTQVALGGTALVYDVLVPANGYEMDTLQEIQLRNQGGATGATDLDSVSVWRDGGDDAFDGGIGDDVLIGTATSSGMDWAFTGLSVAIPPAGQRIYATAYVAAGATPGATIRFSIDGPGSGGLVMASGNDGPLDASVLSPLTVTISEPLSSLAIETIGHGGGDLLPGDDTATVYRFRIINQSAAAESLNTLTFTNDAAGPGTVAQLDAEWTPLTLTATSTDGTVLPGGLPVASPPFGGGVTTFFGLEIELAPTDTTVFTVTGGASLLARNDDVLDLALADSTAVGFARPIDLAGSWPLDWPGVHRVDGMSAAQVVVDGGTPGVVLTGSTRNLVLSIVVPPNGYEADTLDYVNVRNAGTALLGEDIDRVEVWWDFDDDGAFEPSGDDVAGLLGAMMFTGDRWEKTALAVPVSTTGRRIFISCDLTEFANESRTLQFELPPNPVPALGMASANDGPIDQAISNPITQTISTMDRLILSSEAIVPGLTSPGDAGVVLLHVSASNTYTVTKSLTGLTVDNLTVGPGSPAERDGDLSLLELRSDSATGPVLATAFFSGGQASFVGLSWDVLPTEERQLYVTGDVSINGAADGDVLSATILNPASLDFADATAVAASWPLDSGAAWTVDGMVRAQITNHGTPVATLGPSEGPALALDVTIPSSGYSDDTLQGLRLRNLGTADAPDLGEIRLWGDGGNGSFDFGGGDDNDLGPCAFLAGDWISPALSEPLTGNGLRVFASVTSSSAPTDSATVRLRIPIDGITVQSGNDGPHDAPADNANHIILSTAALLTTLELNPAASTIGQSVTARMTVRNLGTVAIDSIAPSALIPDVAGRLGLISGPTPGEFTLDPDASATFTWTYQADGAGAVYFSGGASGVERGTGLSRQSLDVQSNSHQVFLQAIDLQVTPVESMPFSINRGQTDVVPLSLTLTNPGSVGGSDVSVLGLTLRLVDEFDAGIIPADVLSRIVVYEGTTVYLDRTSLETAGSTINLDLSTAARVPSGAQATVSLALDVAATTGTPNFRIVVESATSVAAQDATSGAPVTISPAPGESFPMSSGLARVVGEATQLDVSAFADPGSNVAQGQAGVALMRLGLLNPDPDSLAADVRLRSFSITLTDSAGTPFTVPSLILDRIRVESSAQTLVDRAIAFGEGPTLTLTLSPLLSIPVEAPLAIRLEGDLSPTAPLGRFFVELSSAAGFDARDANTGLPVPAIYAADPVRGAPITVMVPADSVLVQGVPRLPASLLVGDVDVPALAVVLTHPGGPATGPVRCDSLAIEPKNELGQPLIPSGFIDRIEVFRGSTSVGLVTNIPSSGDVVIVPLNVPALLPGETDSLEIKFDVEVTAPAGAFQMTIPADGIYAHDDNIGVRVSVAPEAGASFPLSSGVARLESPARELMVEFEDLMPAVLSVDGGEVHFATIALRNTADAAAGDIRVDHLIISAADPDLFHVDVGAAVSRITAVVDGVLWADSGDLDPAAKIATLAAPAEKNFPPGIVGAVELRATLREGSPVEGVRLGLEAAGIGVVQPSSSVLSILVLAQDGQSFPFWTQSASFSQSSLADSWVNFPNPFAAGRSRTNFAFYLPKPGRVSMNVWSVRGRNVITILDQVSYVSGLHQGETWDGRNARGDVVVNGVYLAEIRVTYDDGSSEQHLRKVAVVR